MDCDEAGLLIHLFMDKEIDEKKEKELFSHLAECNKCREEFRMLRSAQKTFHNSLKEYPDRLDKRVIESLKKKEMKPEELNFYKAASCLLFIRRKYFRYNYSGTISFPHTRLQPAKGT